MPSFADILAGDTSVLNPLERSLASRGPTGQRLAASLYTSRTQRVLPSTVLTGQTSKLNAQVTPPTSPQPPTRGVSFTGASSGGNEGPTPPLTSDLYSNALTQRDNYQKALRNPNISPIDRQKLRKQLNQLDTDLPQLQELKNKGYDMVTINPNGIATFRSSGYDRALDEAYQRYLTAWKQEPFHLPHWHPEALTATPGTVDIKIHSGNEPASRNEFERYAFKEWIDYGRLAEEQGIPYSAAVALMNQPLFQLELSLATGGLLGGITKLYPTAGKWIGRGLLSYGAGQTAGEVGGMVETGDYSQAPGMLTSAGLGLLGGMSGYKMGYAAVKPGYVPARSIPLSERMQIAKTFNEPTKPSVSIWAQRETFRGKPTRTYMSQAEAAKFKYGTTKEITKLNTYFDATSKYDVPLPRKTILGEIEQLKKTGKVRPTYTRTKASIRMTEPEPYRPPSFETDYTAPGFKKTPGAIIEPAYTPEKGPTTMYSEQWKAFEKRWKTATPTISAPKGEVQVNYKFPPKNIEARLLLTEFQPEGKTYKAPKIKLKPKVPSLLSVGELQYRPEVVGIETKSRFIFDTSKGGISVQKKYARVGMIQESQQRQGYITIPESISRTTPISIFGQLSIQRQRSAQQVKQLQQQKQLTIQATQQKYQFRPVTTTIRKPQIEKYKPFNIPFIPGQKPSKKKRYIPTTLKTPIRFGYKERKYEFGTPSQVLGGKFKWRNK